MPTYKLTYFNLKARGEFIRCIFAEAGVEYVDERIPFNPADFSEWIKLKPSMIFGQVPQLEIDGKPYCQSIAIARYLARTFNLAGKTELDQFRADMIVSCIEDIISAIITASVHGKDEEKHVEKETKLQSPEVPQHLTNLENILKENASGDGYLVGNDVERLTKLLTAELPVYLTNLEKILKENNGGDGFFVGDDLTWADINLSVLTNYLAIVDAKLDGHPKLEALVKRVESRPRLAAWFAKRPPTMMLRK